MLMESTVIFERAYKQNKRTNITKNLSFSDHFTKLKGATSDTWERAMFVQLSFKFILNSYSQLEAKVLESHHKADWKAPLEATRSKLHNSKQDRYQTFAHLLHPLLFCALPLSQTTANSWNRRDPWTGGLQSIPDNTKVPLIALSNCRSRQL